MQGGEAVVLGLVDGAGGRKMGEDEAHSAHVPPQSCMVQAVEAIVVGGRDVRLGLQQQLHHVVALLGYGVMEGRVSLQVLQV